MEQVVALDLGVVPAGVAIAERKALAAHLVGARDSGAGRLAHAAQPILAVLPIALGPAEDAHVAGVAVHQNQPAGVAAELLGLLQHALLSGRHGNGLGGGAAVGVKLVGVAVNLLGALQAAPIAVEIGPLVNTTPLQPTRMHLALAVEVVIVLPYLLLPFHSTLSLGVDVVFLPAGSNPAGLHHLAVRGKHTHGAVGFPGDRAGHHVATAIKIVVRAVDALLPLHRMGIGGVEVISLATNLLEAGKRLAVGAKVTLGLIGVPGNPTGHHLVLPIEVVPAAVNLLLPLHRLKGLGVEVVGLAANLLEPRTGLAVSAEVAFGAVGVPGEQTAGIHLVLAIEVVQIAVDGLFPFHRLKGLGA